MIYLFLLICLALLCLAPFMPKRAQVLVFPVALIGFLGCLKLLI